VVVFTADISNEVLHKLVHIGSNFLRVNDKVGIGYEVADFGFKPLFINMTLV